jgi:hypothetical protein
MEQSERGNPQGARHITRSTQAKEEETKTYRVKVGQTWGVNPELQAGDTVELTEKEAAGFEDKLEPLGRDKTTSGETPPPAPTAPAVPKKN